jgi:hypothetical protein
LSEAAQIAASVEYDIIPPPAGLSGYFRPSEATSLKFLAIKTIDGLPMEAALWQPNGREAARPRVLAVLARGARPNDLPVQLPAKLYPRA